MRLLLLTLGLTVVFSTPAYSEEQENLITQLERDAGQGEASAQLFLGQMYAEGQGVPQDYAKAVAWATKAAAQGLASAQLFLGQMYAKGQGVPQDYAKAVAWYTKAAAQGEANAQLNLGVMYAKAGRAAGSCEGGGVVHQGGSAGGGKRAIQSWSDVCRRHGRAAGLRTSS